MALTEFTSATLPTSALWRAVAYDGVGRFVAIAEGTTAAFSDDGCATWSSATLPNALWFALAHNGNVFCAASQASSKQVAISADGESWTAVELSTTGSFLWGVAALGSLLCVISNAENEIATSANDGVDWAVHSFPFSARNICASDTQFCVIGYGTNCAVSSNGVDWTTGTLPIDTFWTDVSWDGTRFYAVSNENDLISSLDGLSWVSHGLMPGPGSAYLVASNPSVTLFATSNDDYTVGTYNHGSSFLPATPSLPGTNWSDLLATSDRVVAITDDGTMVAYATLPVAPAIVALTNNVAIAGISSPEVGDDTFYIDVPANAELTVTLTGANGDADLYLKIGALPTTTDFDYRSWEGGSNEELQAPPTSGGRYYILIDHSYGAYTDLTILASYTVGDFWTGFINCGEAA